MANPAIGAAVVLAIVVVGLAIWLVPRWQVQGWRRAGIAEEEKLAELVVQARSSITQAFGGLALIGTLAVTAYQVNETRRSSSDNLRLAEQGQVSERFSRAVEQLGARDANGHAAIDVRTGALFSLLRIGLDSTANREPAFLVVASYTDTNYQRPPLPAKPSPDGCAVFHSPGRDLTTALTSVLPLIAEKLLEDTSETTLRGLRGAKLRGLSVDGLVLKRFSLTEVKLSDAYLVNADFRDSDLSSATFDRARLGRADFRHANLTGSSFRQACLRTADLQEAILLGADFSGARLEGADLRDARISRTTDFTSAQVKPSTRRPCRRRRSRSSLSPHNPRRRPFRGELPLYLLLDAGNSALHARAGTSHPATHPRRTPSR